MMDIMQQLMGLQMGGSSKGDPHGDGGSIARGRSHTYQPPHTPQCGQADCPNMPHFVDESEPERELDPVADLVNSLASDFDAYEGLDARIKQVMSFGEYIHLKERHTIGARAHYKGGPSNQDMQKIARKVTLPKFDGSAKSSTKAWIQKLDTYFHLNPLPETDAIRFATLHLEGGAQEWWYHGMITLDHSHITSYTEFTRRLLERFEKKDSKLHFRELAHLRQSGSAKAYISEFQRLAVMVTDISKAWLIMLFVEGLAEPLCGWERDYKPISFKDAISRTQDMIDVVPKTWAFVPPRPTTPQGKQDTRPPQRDGGQG